MDDWAFQINSLSVWSCKNKRKLYRGKGPVRSHRQSYSRLQTCHLQRQLSADATAIMHGFFKLNLFNVELSPKGYRRGQGWGVGGVGGGEVILGLDG